MNKKNFLIRLSLGALWVMLLVSPALASRMHITSVERGMSYLKIYYTADNCDCYNITKFRFEIWQGTTASYAYHDFDQYDEYHRDGYSGNYTFSGLAPGSYYTIKAGIYYHDWLYVDFWNDAWWSGYTTYGSGWETPNDVYLAAASHVTLGVTLGTIGITREGSSAYINVSCTPRLNLLALSTYYHLRSITWTRSLSIGGDYRSETDFSCGRDHDYKGLRLNQYYDLTVTAEYYWPAHPELPPVTISRSILGVRTPAATVVHKGLFSLLATSSNPVPKDSKGK